MSRTEARRLIPEDPLPRASAAAESRSTWIVVAWTAEERTILGHIPNATHQEATLTASAFFFVAPGTSLIIADWHTSTSGDRFAAKSVCVLPAAASLG